MKKKMGGLAPYSLDGPAALSQKRRMTAISRKRKIENIFFLIKIKEVSIYGCFC